MTTLFIEPGGPGAKGYNESFSAKLRDDLLRRLISYSRREAEMLIQRLRQHDNTVGAHRALGY